MIKEKFDYIVVGTGPGGAPVAHELAKAGMKVLIIERGKYHTHLLGFPFGMRLSERFFIFNRSKEGVVMERGLTVGGSSMIYQGNVYDPSERFIKKFGLDFREEANDIKKEIGVKSLPERFFNRKGATGLNRLIESAEKLGYPFEAQEKFVDPEKCKEGCDWCMLGCTEGAKWTTRVLIDEAVEKYNATLLVSSKVDKLIITSDGKVEGVEVKGGKKYYAERTILSAGGIGSPAIMIRSGINYPGKRFFMDPMTILYGISKHKNGGTYAGQTFSHAIEHFADSDGFMIGNNASFGTWMVMSMIRPKVVLKNWYKFPFIKRGVGLFVKLAEDDKGEIYSNERTSKPMTEEDIKRMDKGINVARELMIDSGVKEKSISELRWAGGHPGGTIEMGKYVDKNFETEHKNLYVCDASLFPVSPGAPPSLSIMAMSRMLSKFLLGKIKPEDRLV